MKLRISVAVLVALGLSAIFADFFSPYGPADQNRDRPLNPPSRIGIERFSPVVRMASRPAAPILFLAPGPQYRLLGLFPTRTHLFEVAEPDRFFLLGSDEFGRDQFSRLLYGGRISLVAGLLATGLALALALFGGVVAGYYGGIFDAVFMRAAELFLALPWLYLLLGIRAFLPLSLAPGRAFLFLIAILGIVGWARPARLVRGIVLSAKEREYVYAARGFGASGVWILRRHILADTWSPLLVQASLLLPQFILAEVTMSFFGLGVGEPAASWGTLLVPLLHIPATISFWWLALPALFLLPTFVTFHICANALEERARSISS